MSTVITISRQLGSRGSYIAAEVARALNLKYMDREILHRAAEIAGGSTSELIAQLEAAEKAQSLLPRFLQAITGMPQVPAVPSATLREAYAQDETIAALMREGFSREEALRRVPEAHKFEAYSTYADLVHQVILELAQQGNVIIVGRGGHIILKDMPHVLRVLIVAPEEVRVQTLMERMGINRKEAERRIRQSDKERAAYLKRYHGTEHLNPVNYDLVLNTGHLSVDTSVALICEAARRVCGNAS